MRYPRLSTARGRGVEVNRKTPGGPPFVSIMADPSETQLQLSRKALVNSTLLSLDETSVSPATNSIIDF